MLKSICKFLSILLIAVTFTGGANAALNIPTGDIGDFGSWATDINRDLIVASMQNDAEEFIPDTSTQLVDNYVPIEAKVGFAFMHAMSYVADVIDKALAPFAISFIVLMYLFWVMGEAYNNMKKGWDIKKLGKEIMIKTLKVGIWIAVLNFGPAKLFSMIMVPILRIGTLTADAILNTAAHVVDIELPDTCAAINNYVSSNAVDKSVLDANTAAHILCLPTRLSGYFTSGIALGWEYIKASFGNSAFLFVLGLAFVIIFTINAWKFTFMAFGVIADLFLAIIMLPFTAVSETVTKTSYDGIPGTVYNAFTGLFKAESLKAQIGRVISAAIYFVVLAVVIAVCITLMSGFINMENLSDADIISMMVTGFLVWYLANRADEIAKDWGGNIKDEFGKKLRSNVETLAKDFYKTGERWYKAFKNR